MIRAHRVWIVAISLACAAGLCTRANAQFETRITTPFLFSDDDNGLAAADFNHDGKLDVAVASQDLNIFLGKGDGTFRSPIQYTLGRSPNSIAVADLNGDGNLDIAVTNFLSGTVSVLFGNGDGTFTLSETLPTSAEPGFIRAGDFNGDGKPDLALLDGSFVSVFLNTGNGTFGAPMNIQIAGVGLGVGDFDRDGVLDLAVANNQGGGGGLIILLGNGDGSFTEKASYSQYGQGVVGVGDFRGNGLLDLVVSPYITPEVVVYLGNGDGTFQHGVVYPAEWGNSVAVADLNGDGKQDLVLSNLVGTVGDGNVFVLFGNGDGSFQPSQGYPTGILPDYVAVGDFNGDGMPDVINVDRDGEMFTLLNTGTASFYPTSPVTFPPQVIGTTSTPMAVRMTNSGTTPITISSVTSSGPPFKITKNACPASLAPGAQCKISAAFAPTVKDSVSGAIAIVDSASSKPQVVELTGPGTVVKLSPSALTFPPTKVGSTSAPQTIQLTNTGSTTLNFNRVMYVGGGYGNDYPESSNCRKQLAAGASCTITIQFSPHNTGTRNAYLVIQDDGGGSPQQPKLSGTGD